MGGKQLLLPALIALLLIPVAPPAAANHEYQQSVWFTWHKKTLDVLIVGYEDPIIGKAVRDGVRAWEIGLPQLAPNLGLTFRVYWPTTDPVPPPNFQADIVVAPQGFFALNAPWASQAFPPKCYAFAPMVAGWGTMYSVTSHEFGHCLGLDHVFNHGVEYSPAKDIMGSGSPGKACPSNLNVKVLERVFSGQAGTITMSASQYVQASSC
jgi:hypothetical protein